MTYDAIPSALLTECLISLAPDPTEQVNARLIYPKAKSDMEARYLMMSDAWFKQTGNLIACDLQIKQLSKWNKLHLENNHDTRRETK